MKAISLTQPWAVLVANGEKKIDTRSWRTDYRGQLAIHASKKITDEAKNKFHNDTYFVEALKRLGITNYGMLVTGAILAKVRLVDVIRTDDIVKNLSEKEIVFGDYSVGRWAWIFEDLVQFPSAIEAKGSLGLWSWNDERTNSTDEL